ncbi:MAG TPA: TrmH family RNA methyltransferase, partial [Draconibacterium sp.]|nr:TrmH family RNA methyltransferase [Draconibacterium sp.]
IPMYGFTESFNISVSAAIILHHLTLKMRNTKGFDWRISDEEMAELKLEWIRRTIKRSDLIEKRFLEKNKE